MPFNQHFEKHYPFESLIVINVNILMTQNHIAFSGIYQIVCLNYYITRTFTPRKYKSHPSLSQIVCLILNAINLVKHFDPKTDHHTKFHQDP